MKHFLCVVSSSFFVLCILVFLVHFAVSCTSCCFSSLMFSVVLAQVAANFGLAFPSWLLRWLQYVFSWGFLCSLLNC